jgi:predicted acetyltransferase
MDTPYPLRPIAESEFSAFYRVIERAFNATYPHEPELEHDRPIFEFDRTLAAFDGTDIVGTALAFTLPITVPGGALTAAGVTAVGVLPSHRRRGILSSLMRRQLADTRDRGVAVAALFASEGGIYGRYGYGVATTELTLTVKRGEVLAAPAAGNGRTAGTGTGPAGTGPAGTGTGPAGTGPTLRLRGAEPSGAVPDMSRVYDAVQRDRPGMAARDRRWWDYYLWDPEYRREGFSQIQAVIAEDDTGARGYALFSAKPDWDEYGIPIGVMRLWELMAVDPAAHTALWNDLLTRDLVGEVRARMRPADEPLLYLLADPRRARPLLSDGLWIRLVSVPGALSRRSYSCPVDVVIEVSDELLTENAGRWRLRAPGPAGQAGPEVVTCERTTAPADLALPVRALGAAYLGGTRLSALAGAGLVAEIRPGSVAALSAAMSCDPAPWCPASF